MSWHVKQQLHLEFNLRTLAPSLSPPQSQCQPTPSTGHKPQTNISMKPLFCVLSSLCMAVKASMPNRALVNAADMAYHLHPGSPPQVHAAAVVSETVRQQILDRQRRMAAAEDAPEMSKPQTAALQRDIAAILLPGESVTRALQRLGKQDKRPAGLCSCVLSQHAMLPW